MKITVFEIIGEFAVAATDGQHLYDRMIDQLGRHETIELDFAGVRVVATPFFNAAVGRLLKDISPEDLHKKISFTNLTAAGQRTLATVVQNAKQYYHDPGAREALDKILVDHTDEY
jgi:hypothetical protein